MNQYLTQDLRITLANGGFAVQQATEGGWDTIDVLNTREEAIAFMEHVGSFVHLANSYGVSA